MTIHKKAILISFIILMFFIGTSSATTVWYSKTFGGSVTIEQTGAIVNSVSPVNETEDVDFYPTLSVNLSHTYDETFNITWTTNTSSWTASNTTCTNGTYNQTASFTTTDNTWYWWTIHVEDQTGDWYNYTYKFETRDYTWSSSAGYFSISRTVHSDLNEDLKVDNTDLSMFQTNYTKTSSYTGDINQDGKIDYLDRSILQNYLGSDYT